LLGWWAFAWAQDYPNKIVRWVVVDQPGSNADTLARIIAEGLTEVFGKQVIVDNRPGAAGNIGTEFAARAAPDGYTVVEIPTTQTVNVTLYSKMPYDLVRDFAPITNLAASPNVVVVPASSPIKSISDLVKFAKAKPGAMNFSSAGTGSCTFLAGEIFKRQAGVEMQHVPYKGGGDALTAVISGEVQVYFAPIPVALPHIRSGKLRALAVTSEKPFPSIPEYPTIADAGLPGYQFNCWYGLLVPAGTPPQVIATLHRGLVAVLNKPDVRKRLVDIGFLPVGDRPEEFAAFIKSQIEVNREIVRGLPPPQ
jgi:tripartite-type tricarboxylate transporter receptor subunit TctC